MFRPATRLIARSSRVGAPSSLLAPPFFTRAAPARRCISTAPPSQKSRSWKSLVARVGLAGAVIYFYNTTEVFADEPRHAVHQVPELADENDQLPTIEALAQERRQRKAELVAEKNQAAGVGAQGTAGAGDVQELEEEAGQQGAFNPETGEINWDCPCLGGMATGPCGEQFKAAFSCFVYSTEEPKGMDCVDKFKDMQNCFREYPEVYGSELEGDDDDDDDVTGDEELAALADSESAPSEKAADSRPEVVKQAQRERGRAETEQRKKEQALGGGDEVVPRDERREMERALSESDELVPKAGHDERQANEQHLQSRSK